MADFCKKCSEDIFKEDFGELAGIAKPGLTVAVICEGCEHQGPCLVDFLGVCQVREKLEKEGNYPQRRLE